MNSPLIANCVAIGEKYHILEEDLMTCKKFCLIMLGGKSRM